MSPERLLSQHYTRPDVAARFLATFCRFVDPDGHLLYEPAAGTGAFFNIMPAGSRGCDKEPKCPGIETADFLTVTIPTGRPVGVVGNPPFGTNDRMALKFLNHAATQANYVGFILPRSFRKTNVQKLVNSHLHLIHDEDVERFAFVFRGRPYHIEAVFQIWQRRSERRVDPEAETTHPDFEFTTRERAHFAVQRVGAQAGRIHRDFERSDQSTYFIRVLNRRAGAIIPRLALKRAAANVACKPSLAKSELVALYREEIERLI